MANNQITLINGVMDFSGPHIIYKDREDSDTGPVLPYKVENVKQSGPPEKFLRFMESNFPDRAIEEAILYYLSLIPARETGYKYIGIFYGVPMTGKTATIEVMREVLPGYLVNVSIDKLSARHKTDGSLLVKIIDGKGAVIIGECPRNEKIDTAALKTITNKDTVTAAQIAFCTNQIIDLGENDLVLYDRLVVFHFTQTHNNRDPATRNVHQIISDLRPEFPGMVRYFIERYIKLRDTLDGKIPEAPNCKHLKKQFHLMRER